MTEDSKPGSNSKAPRVHLKTRTVSHQRLLPATWK